MRKQHQKGSKQRWWGYLTIVNNIFQTFSCNDKRIDSYGNVFSRVFSNYFARALFIPCFGVSLHRVWLVTYLPSIRSSAAHPFLMFAMPPRWSSLTIGLGAERPGKFGRPILPLRVLPERDFAIFRNRGHIRFYNPVYIKERGEGFHNLDRHRDGTRFIIWLISLFQKRFSKSILVDDSVVSSVRVFRYFSSIVDIQHVLEK